MNSSTFKIYALLLCAFITHSTNAQKKSKLTKANPNNNIVVSKSNSGLSGPTTIKSHKRTPMIDLGEFKNYRTTDLSIINRGLKLSSEYTFLDSGKAIVKDKLGQTHQRYTQYYNGIPVLWGEMTLHREKSGIASKMNGEYYEIKNVSTVPSLSISNIASKSKAEGIIGYNSFNFNRNKENGKLTAKLVFVPNLEVDLTVKNMPTANLAYEMVVFANNPTRIDKVYLDANTGILLYKYPLMMHADRFDRVEKEMGINLEELAEHNKCIAESKIENNKVTNYNMVAGTGETRYSGTRTIDTEVSGGSFRLWNDARNIKTFDVEGRDFGSGWTTYADIRAENKDIFDADNTWTQAEHNGPGDDDDYNAFDAHWATMIIMDFWDTTFSWDSWDGAGGETRNHIHRGTDLDNAGFIADAEVGGIGYMSYGNGNLFTPLVSLDVAGHEVGHGTTNATSGLAYQNQSGALNEGFSDIWGVVIENYGNTTAGLTKDISLVGEEIINGYNGWPALRSMVSPKDCGQPDTYLGTNWIATGDEGSCVPDPETNDHCGVHTNSGVLNHWFYLLFSGGTGTNDIGDTYNVTALDIDDAAAIAWRTNSVYLGANSTYADARASSITSAIDLYGACSAEEESVTNAWYAVGVGAAYATSCVPEITFSNSLGNTIEGSDCNYTDVSVPVIIGSAASANAIVTFSITGGSATSGIDYSLMTPSVTFTAGTTTTQNMTLRVFNDNFIEGNEDIILDFAVNANGGDAVAGVSSMTFTINDDNVTPTETSMVDVINEDFEAAPAGWTLLDEDGDGNNWEIGDAGVAHISTGQLLSRSWNNTVGALSPDNYVMTNQVTIPSDLTTLNLTYQVAPSTLTETWFEEYYTIYWATDISSAAAINSSTEIKLGSIVAQAVVNEDIDMAAYIGLTGYLVLRHHNCTDEEFIAIDNLILRGTTNTKVQSAVTAASDPVNLNGAGTIYSSDTTTNNLMLSITNNNTFDYGCTDVSVSRAGIGAQSYLGSAGNNLVMDKRYTISPTNSTSFGDVEVNFYITDAELTGWETGNTPNQTRGNLIAYKENTSEVSSLTVTPFGSNHILTATFTGLGGDYYLGPNSLFTTLSTNNSQLKEVSLYPNPVKDIVYIEGLDIELSKIEIYNIIGKRVLLVSGNTTTSVNMNQLKTGVYFMKLYTGNTNKTIKLIKE